MNPSVHPDNLTDVPWPTSDERAPPVPSTSMLPGSEKTPSPAIGLLKSAVKASHQTIDRMAERATPAVQQLGDHVAAAAEALRVQTDELRVTRDVWAEEARATIRRKPLTSVAVALAVGVVIARLTR